MANARIHVGNLPYSFGDRELHDLFATFGPVRSARVMKDRETGQSRGFGFVEMDTAEAAQKAIKELNGKEFEGMMLRPSEARERDARPGGPPSGAPSHAGGGAGGPRPGPGGEAGTTDAGNRSFGPPSAPAWQRERERQGRAARAKPVKGKGPRRGDDGAGDDFDKDY